MSRSSVRIPIAALLAAATALTAPATGARPSAAQAAQAGAAEELVVVELRVTSVGPDRLASVDRGATDGLIEGDFVRLYPRGGGTFRAVVLRVDDRSAVVEIAHPTWTPEPGTKGGVQIPRQRIEAMLAARKPRPGVPAATATELQDPPAAAETDPAQGGPPTDDPSWQNADGDWSKGMPLLAEVGAVRPQDRAMRFGGLFYVIADSTWASPDSRTDTFVRTGTDLYLDNPFGYGGRLHLDAETNYRNTDVDEQVDESKTLLRFNRLSYSVGGTRFERTRWEGGRFLQDGMPEFGVIDGLEVSTRLSSGDRAGGSIGFMPELDEDYETGADFQLAGWYRWSADEEERLTATAGYQKSFHDADADRDLFVAKLAWLPERGWTVQGTVWVDLYTSGDDAKDAFLELTQAWIGAHKSNPDGSGMGVTLTHIAFPQIDRYEFLPPLEEQLADDRSDRLAFSTWHPYGGGKLLGAEIGIWNDEDDTGGDLELALDIEDALSERDSLGFVLFGANGAFSTVIGGRIDYRHPAGEQSWWDIGYELSHQDQLDFDDEDADFLMHWLHGGWNRTTSSGWSISLRGDGRAWAEEFSLGAGIYLTRSF